MEKIITVRGKQIFYRELGQGPAVLLLHGFGEDGSIWKHQYESILGFRFIVPDLPGTGLSETVSDMSMEGLASVMNELMDQVLGKDEQFFLIGHSMGGYISLAYAEKYPERLKGLGLFHSSAFADSEEKKKTRRKAIEFIETHGPGEFLKTLVPTLYGPDTKEKHPEKIEEHLASTHNFSGAALVSYYVSMIERPDRTGILKNTDLPVLLVLGRHDQAVPVNDGLKLSYMADLTYIHLLENSGHMGMVEEMKESNELLTNYLTGNEKTAQPE